MNRKTIGATFLVAGTCIGGGMLGLPVITGELGFVPSTAVLGLVWLMMTITALLYMEVCLSMGKGAHIVTISEQLLGSWVKGLNGVVFAFVSYASLIAYVFAGGIQLAEVLNCSAAVGQLIFLLSFGLFLLWNANSVERLNSILFIGLVAAYAMLMMIGFDDVTVENLSHARWSGLFSAFPIILAAFSFQVFLVPTITDYLDYEPRAVRRALVGGTTLTLLFYLVWQWLVLGTVPQDQLGVALANGHPATSYFSRAVSSPIVATIAECFAFFAVATSFLGIALGLQDFVADTGRIKKKGMGMVGLTAVVLVPTFFGVLYFEKAFTSALDATGGFGDTLINGMIPVALVWVLRYHRNLETECRLPCGRPLLVVTFLFYLAVLLEDLYRTLFV